MRHKRREGKIGLYRESLESIDEGRGVKGAANRPRELNPGAVWAIKTH